MKRSEVPHIVRAVGTVLRPILASMKARIDSLETQFRDIPAGAVGPQGPKGEDGKSADAEKIMLDVMTRIQPVIQLDRKSFRDELLPQLIATIEAAIASTREKLTETLLRRIAEIPIAKDGERGPVGPIGPQGPEGKPGPAGERGERGIQGERGPAGEMGIQGARGEVGSQGAPGPSGERGERGERGEIGPPGERGAIGEIGPQGPEGRVGPIGPVGERGAAGERGETGPQGQEGKPGPAGERGPVGERGERGERGIDGRDGREGKDGRDGAPGRDAAEIEILPGIDESRSYPAGTLASHRGGLVRWTGASWQVVVRGTSQEIFEVSPEDPRRYTRRTVLSDGETAEFSVRIPVPIYRGVFAAGVDYEQGDLATHAGSTWHCSAEKTHSAPGTNGDWQLIVKRGSDGKPGKDGRDGEPGPQGPPGQDLRYK